VAEVRWTLQAAGDLEAIADFIAADSAHYARLFVIDVLAAVERLVAFPSSGRIVPELNDPRVREILLGNYRIVYRLTGMVVEILTVYHGARLLDPSTSSESLAMAAESKRRFVGALLAVTVFVLGVPAVAAILFFPVMYLAGAHTGVLSGLLAGVVWVVGLGATVVVPAWFAVWTYRHYVASTGVAR